MRFLLGTFATNESIRRLSAPVTPPREQHNGINLLLIAASFLGLLSGIPTAEAAKASHHLQRPHPSFTTLQNATFIEAGFLYPESSMNSIVLDFSFGDMIEMGQTLETEWSLKSKEWATRPTKKQPLFIRTVDKGIKGLNNDAKKLQFEAAIRSNSTVGEVLHDYEDEDSYPETPLLDWAHKAHKAHEANSTGNNVRVEREVNFDVKIDGTTMINSFFTGMSSLFHYKSLQSMEKEVNHIKTDFKGLTCLVGNMTDNMNTLKSGQSSLTRDFNGMETAIDMIQDIAETRSVIQRMTLGLHSLAQGHIDPILLPLEQAKLAFEQLVKAMAEQGFRPIISQALDIFNMPITYFFQNNKVRIYIHIPGYLISELPFKLYEFSPLSIIQHAGAYFMIKSTDRFLAVQEGLESDAKMIVMSVEEFHHKVRPMGPKKWAVFRPRIIKDPQHHCLSTLFYEHGLETCPASKLFEIMPIS